MVYCECVYLVRSESRVGGRVILNWLDICIPLDNSEPWRLLFIYHLDAPAPSVQFKQHTMGLENRL